MSCFPRLGEPHSLSGWRVRQSLKEFETVPQLARAKSKLNFCCSNRPNRTSRSNGQLLEVGGRRTPLGIVWEGLDVPSKSRPGHV